MEGFNKLDLKELDNPIRMLSHRNSRSTAIKAWAAVLSDAGRLAESRVVSRTAIPSALAPFYPDSRETPAVIRLKRRRRSVVAVPSPKIEQECVAESKTPYDAHRKPRVGAAIDFMKVNLHRRIGVAELAKTVNLSRSHFSRVFKVETGVSPGEYLIRLRMEKAGELLRTSFLSIKQVMAAVGYNNKSNFARNFKNHFDLTPSEYRKQAATIIVSRAETNEDQSLQSAAVGKVLQFPLAESTVDTEFTPGELERLRNVSLTPIQLLGAILKIVLKDRVTDKEIIKICTAYYNTLKDWWG